MEFLWGELDRSVVNSDHSSLMIENFAGHACVQNHPLPHTLVKSYPLRLTTMSIEIRKWDILIAGSVWPLGLDLNIQRDDMGVTSSVTCTQQVVCTTQIRSPITLTSPKGGTFFAATQPNGNSCGDDHRDALWQWFIYAWISKEIDVFLILG